MALRIGTNIHALFESGGLNASASGFPTSVELIVTPYRQIDVGASLEMPLEVAVPANAFTSALFVRFRH